MIFSSFRSSRLEATQNTPLEMDWRRLRLYIEFLWWRIHNIESMIIISIFIGHEFVIETEASRFLRSFAYQIEKIAKSFRQHCKRMTSRRRKKTDEIWYKTFSSWSIQTPVTPLLLFDRALDFRSPTTATVEFPFSSSIGDGCLRRSLFAYFFLSLACQCAEMCSFASFVMQIKMSVKPKQCASSCASKYIEISNITEWCDGNDAKLNVISLFVCCRSGSGSHPKHFFSFIRK